MTARAHAGFTLTELAVVLAIVSLLIGGMLLPISGQQDMRQRDETSKALAAIQESLLGFAVMNGRLPCPATPTLPSGTGGFCPAEGSASVAGCEATSGSGAALVCVSEHGVLPWATLGLPEGDAWGNRYSYRVTAMFARGIDPGQAIFGNGCALNPSNHGTYDPELDDGPRRAAFAICTPGDINVLAAAGGTTVANGVPVVIVSHGRNGAGAYSPQGHRLAAGSGDEAENANDDAVFVSSNAIDDQVQWIPRSLLMNRMLVAGKLP